MSKEVGPKLDHVCFDALLYGLRQNVAVRA